MCGYLPNGVTVFLAESASALLYRTWVSVFSRMQWLYTCMLRSFSGTSENLALEVGAGGVRPLLELRCEADEADTRVWLRAYKVRVPVNWYALLIQMCITLVCLV